MTATTAMLLVGIGRLAERRVDAALAEIGLSLRLVGALGHLSDRPELSYSDLARRARVTPPSMRATVGHLEHMGAVRIDSSGQGVAAQIAVTAKGRALLERARAAIEQLDEDAFAELPDEVLVSLRELLLAQINLS